MITSFFKRASREEKELNNLKNVQDLRRRQEEKVQKELRIEESKAEIIPYIQEVIDVDSGDELAVGDLVHASYQRMLTSAVNVEASTKEKVSRGFSIIQS
jgi:hypothetical protein